MNCPGNFHQASKHALTCSQTGPDPGPLSYSQADPCVTMVTNQLGPFQQGHVASEAITGHQGWPNLLSRYKKAHWMPTRLGPRHPEPRAARLSQSPCLAAHKDQGLGLRAVAPPACGGCRVVRRPWMKAGAQRSWGPAQSAAAGDHWGRLGTAGDADSCGRASLTSRAIWFSASSSAVSRSRLGSRLRPDPCVPMSIGHGAQLLRDRSPSFARPAARSAPRSAAASWRQRRGAGDAGDAGGRGQDRGGSSGTPRPRGGTQGRRVVMEMLKRWRRGSWGQGHRQDRDRGY